MNILLDNLLLLLLAIFLEGISPLAMNILVQETSDGRQRLLAIANHSHISLDDFIDFRLINIKMDNLSLLGIFGRNARDTVTESHTDGNEHITLLSLHIGSIRTMHTEHTHIKRMVARKSRKTEQGTTSRDISLLQEFNQFIMSTTQFYAMTDESERALCLIDEFSSFSYSLFINLRIWIIGCNLLTFHRFPLTSSNLGILGEVEYYRSRTTATSDEEGTAYSPCHILRTANLIRPLRDRLGNAHQVNFLEGISTQSAHTHLSGDDHDRCRIHHGIRNTGERISCSRTTSNESNTHFAADSGVALCSVSSSLLVTNQDVIEHLLLSSRVTIQCIKHWHDATTWVTEDGLNPFVMQGAHQCFSSCYYFFCHLSISYSE